jgi:excisionase family DNA binding protein
MESQTRFYKLSEVARIFGVSRSHVLALIHSGRLRSVQFGPRCWHRIPVGEVERLTEGE